MNVTEITIGGHALIQTNANTQEHAYIKAVNKENGLLIVRLSNGVMTEIHPQYVIKMFK